MGRVRGGGGVTFQIGETKRAHMSKRSSSSPEVIAVYRTPPHRTKDSGFVNWIVHMLLLLKTRAAAQGRANKRKHKHTSCTVLSGS